MGIMKLIHQMETRTSKDQSILLECMFFTVIFYVSSRCWGAQKASLGLGARRSGVGDFSVDDEQVLGLAAS